MKHILIVDDQPCVRELLKVELILDGHRVTEMGHKESVRKFLSASTPDLVVLDLILGKEDDQFYLLSDIKHQAPGVPIIIFTAYDGFRNDPRASQADAYIIKTFDLTGLKKTIQSFLSTSRDDKPSRKDYPFAESYA